MKKKLLAILLTTVMAVSVTGCGGADDKKETTTAKNEKTTAGQTTTGADAPTEVVPPTPELATPEELPAQPFAHITFDGEVDEGYKAVTQATKAADSAGDGANFDIVDATDAVLTYEEGPVGKCLFVDGKFGLDLGLKPTNTDQYTVSFWMNAERLATFGPTLQVGYNMHRAADAGNNVTWFNVTQCEWGDATLTDGGRIFPMVWSRSETGDAADGADCWPWMATFDNTVKGKKEWVMVTIVCTGEEQVSPVNGATYVGAEYYVNGMKYYDSADNFTNHTYWAEWTWDATLAPNIMKPAEGAVFQSYFGINYWDTILKGYVDDLYVYDTALTPGQVATLYNLGNKDCKTGVEAAQ